MCHISEVASDTRRNNKKPRRVCKPEVIKYGMEETASCIRPSGLFKFISGIVTGDSSPLSYGAAWISK
jgi:hypothetical protein